METRPIFVLLAALLAGAAFADAYTWTDEDGIVHYSDRPHPNAQIIDLESSSGLRPAPIAIPSSTSNDDDDREATPRYTALEIVSPGAEETLWNIEATLSVDLRVTPTLRPGHQIRVYFDGMPQLVGSTSFQLQEVYRGVHNIQAEVIDATGTLLIRSLPSRFYVQQNSVR
jgi:hypothetical protein